MGQMAHKDPQERMEPMVQMVLQVLKGPQVQMVLMVHKVQRAIQAIWGLKVTLDHKVQ